MQRRPFTIATPSPRPRDLTRTAILDQEWRNWSLVKVRIPNLPQGVTTCDIHKNLQRFGRLEEIRIEQTHQGNFANHATVIFK